MHGPLKASRPAASTVELQDPHSLDLEAPEDGEAAEPKMEKSKSLKERLQELSSNSPWDFFHDFLCIELLIKIVLFLDVVEMLRETFGWFMGWF